MTLLWPGLQLIHTFMCGRSFGGVTRDGSAVGRHPGERVSSGGLSVGPAERGS